MDNDITIIPAKTTRKKYTPSMDTDFRPYREDPTSTRPGWKSRLDELRKLPPGEWYVIATWTYPTGALRSAKRLRANVKDIEFRSVASDGSSKLYARVRTP